jgi:hypothetical protein
MWFSSIFHAKS